MGNVDFIARGVIEHGDRIGRGNTIHQLAGVQPHHQHIAGVGISDIPDSCGAVQGDIEEIMVRFSRVDLHAGKELRRFAIEGHQLPVAGNYINFVTRVINGKPHRFEMIQRFAKLLLSRIDNPQQPFVFAPDPDTYRR